MVRSAAESLSAMLFGLHGRGRARAGPGQDGAADALAQAPVPGLDSFSMTCAPPPAPGAADQGVVRYQTSDRQTAHDAGPDCPAACAPPGTAPLPSASPQADPRARARLDVELKLAERVQRSLLPRSLPEVPGYEFFAHYQATYELGGDFYDFIPLDDGRLGVALGDVAGKGVSAALVMAKFSGDTRVDLRAGGEPSAAMGLLNQTLCGAGIDDRFITLSLSMLDARSGRLWLCSAGHLPVILRRADGAVVELGRETSGPPLGLLPDAGYEQAEFTLRPGDVAVVYSDGVSDSLGPADERYDTPDNRRLLRCVAGASGGPAAVGRAILLDLERFRLGRAQADDITLVCFGPVATPAAGQGRPAAGGAGPSSAGQLPRAR